MSIIMEHSQQKCRLPSRCACCRTWQAVKGFCRWAFQLLTGLRLVWQPYQPNRLNCGLVGIVALTRAASEIDPVEAIDALTRLVRKLPKEPEKQLVSLAQPADMPDSDNDALIAEINSRVRFCKGAAVFYRIYSDPGLQGRLKNVTASLNRSVAYVQRRLEAGEGRLARSLAEKTAARLEQLKDIAWILSVEIQQNIERINVLSGGSGKQLALPALERYKELNAVLNSLERLEVRGRDSAGISILVTLTDDQQARFWNGLTQAGLADEYQQRGRPAILLNRTIRVGAPLIRNGAGFHPLAFTYKFAAEVGALGDNTAFVRNQISQDAVLRLLIEQCDWHAHTMIAHTRWASVGAVTEINCHPLDNHSAPVNGCDDLLQVCLNGDIDNYLELKDVLEQQGVVIPAAITTDTQIIPLQIQVYLQQGHDIVTAFRLALNNFTGSHAIALQSSLAPGQLLLGQRGSGQALYVGLADDFYIAASEVYGLIEETSAYLKLEGASEEKGGGRIFILSPTDRSTLAGVQVMDYDGKIMMLSDADIKTSPIVSRDIDRQDYPHYFLKEISEAPQSVARTIQNRWRLTDDQAHMMVVLDDTVTPAALVENLLAGRMRRILFVGQGTAGVAASACAEITATYLENTLIQVGAMKASELSGYKLPESDQKHVMQDTLVVAISQSGTTTDTNRAVDLVRRRGAATLAIVNRRESDLTFKVDGVMYTSSGRDLEMSVASTKAFYAQIVAGALLGLHLAQVLQCRTREFVTNEIRRLLALPEQMRQVLTLKDKIGDSARHLALTRTYWAAVGSGPNKAAADEIRIKLSELCYKTISSDFVEDKKHIDLSSEPLIIICAAGSRGAVIGDIIKDSAIFKAHKALPVVIADAGERRFEPYAADVFYVPVTVPHLAPILNTLVGHLWGYYAALTINAGSEVLFAFREDLQNLVQSHLQSGMDIYEIIIEKSFREKIAIFYQNFRQPPDQLVLPSGTDHASVTDLLLLLKYLSGRLPVADFEMDFGQKGTALNMVNALLESLGRTIAALSRPVDAIKHQAKTVTVGTSRIQVLPVPPVQGRLFEALQEHDIEAAQLTNANVVVLKNLQEIVGAVQGAILYAVEGINLLGEPGEEATIRVLRKTGILASLPSRVESDPRLKGTKRIIVREGNVFIGQGRSDQRNIIIVPVLDASGTASSRIHRLLLLNIDFKTEIALTTRIRALGGKYERIKNIVQENSVSWQDGFLEALPPEMLFGLSAEKTAEFIVTHQDAPVTAQRSGSDRVE